MVNARKLELIKELKALKEQKNITLQEIADRTEANNEKVSPVLSKRYSRTTTIMIMIMNMYFAP